MFDDMIPSSPPRPMIPFDLASMLILGLPWRKPGIRSCRECAREAGADATDHLVELQAPPMNVLGLNKRAGAGNGEA